MVFKVTFGDGSSDTVQAGSFWEARLTAAKQSRDQIVVKVEAAGSARPPSLPPIPAAGRQPQK